jgi:hypothetical protein
MSTDQATRTDRAASDALAFCAIDHASDPFGNRLEFMERVK